MVFGYDLDVCLSFGIDFCMDLNMCMGLGMGFVIVWV